MNEGGSRERARDVGNKGRKGRIEKGKDEGME